MPFAPLYPRTGLSHSRHSRYAEVNISKIYLFPVKSCPKQCFLKCIPHIIRATWGLCLKAVELPIPKSRRPNPNLSREDMESTAGQVSQVMPEHAQSIRTTTF